MAEYSWIDASIEALRQGGPMNARQIVEFIERNGLRTVSGQTPEATVGAVLYTAIQDGDQRIHLASPGVFGAGEFRTPPPAELSLGRLERVDPRSVWPDEARNFTPWLLNNASYLGDVLNLEIQLDAREHPVGPFSLDLFGQDLSNRCVLIVENQLTPTDHKHLGQLLTYAAGTQPQAGTIVWIAPEFRDEHRQALDFLNASVSTEGSQRIRFFGIEIGVVRIANSVPAPQFTVVASPSDFVEQMAEVQSAASGGGKGESYRAFWAKYLKSLNERAPGITKVRTATTASWLTVNYLRKGISIGVNFNNGGLISTELYIDLGKRARNLAVFNALLEQKAQIEQSIGADLSWEELPGRRSCRLRVRREGEVGSVDLQDELVKWMIDNHLKFKEVFRPLVEDLPDEFWSSDFVDEHVD